MCHCQFVHYKLHLDWLGQMPWSIVITQLVALSLASNEVCVFLCNPQVYCCVDKNPPGDSVLSQMNPLCVAPNFLLAHHDIILPSAPSVLSVSSLEDNILCEMWSFHCGSNVYPVFLLIIFYGFLDALCIWVSLLIAPENGRNRFIRNIVH